ncbi:PREDICTED: uncharacterized protein LOC109584558 [Amphimedon queenslandica]|uniref:Ig-like domain-containing protein n=1 Tax=Amphimedon queenslandica TaxID=400682 RepID=A0AAN0JG08_AMPQE|nr:PREDICTED: uncharacterized protein LOC109584558 [Amphimedon queenslandica]|eukprot:XP_019855894.1 PREDICTED: uncharacterized protein LOC109584558 [Amphimedon queenslandica]
MHILHCSVYSFVSSTVPPRVIIQGDVDDGDNVILRSTGQSLSVSCNASHPDENSTNTVTKSWKKEGELLSNDSKLVIAHLSPQDSGVYTCFASFEGLEYNKSFNLTVISDLPSPSPSATESPSTTESTMIIDISTTSPAHSAPEVTSTGTPSPTSDTNKSGVFQNPLMYAIIIIVLLIIVMVLLAVMTLCYFLHCCMKRKKQNESESGSSTGDVELQANQTQDSCRPSLTPSVSSSANDRLTIASSSCCDSCRCTPSIAPSSINPNQSDQCSLGHNPKSHMGSVSNNPSHCASTATCTCSCAHSHNLAPPYFTRPPVHGLHPCSHTPLPSHHAFISFKPANPSISNDSGYTCSLHYPPSETGTSRGYPDTRTVCSHCTKSFIISTDSGYRPMKTSSRLPGYSSYNEGTYNEGTHNEGTLC